MTTYTGVSAQLNEIAPILRDELSSMTNWSVKHDSTGGATTFDGDNRDFVVLTNPDGEDVLIRYSEYSNEYGYELEYGPDYDATNTTWNDRYGQDPHNVYGDEFGPANGASETESCSYWLSYLEGTGWVIGVKAASGGDILSMGQAKLTKLWDYSAAAARESEYATMMMGYAQSSSNFYRYQNGMAEGGPSNESRHATGRPNGDSNYNNYPIMEDNVVASVNYSDTVVGTHNVWFFPASASHGDTVDDSNGNTVYHVLSGSDSRAQIGIRVL